MRASLKTLIVDDNATNLKILERTLKHHFSHLVDVTCLVQAKDGFEAIDAYENESFDMILCDIDMPGMSGVQVAQHIRKNDSDVIFIACTTSDSPSARELYSSTGMDGCVCKPLDLIELNGSITGALQARQDLFDITGSPDIQQRYLIHRNSVSRPTRGSDEYTHEASCHRTEQQDPALYGSGLSDSRSSTTRTSDEDSDTTSIDLKPIQDLPQTPSEIVQPSSPCACMRLCAEVRARLSYNLNLGSYFPSAEVNQLQHEQRKSTAPQNLDQPSLRA